MSRGDQNAMSAAELFDLLWESLADVLGTAATATLGVGRSSRWRLSPPGGEPIIVTRNGLNYEYRLPETWNFTTLSEPALKIIRYMRLPVGAPDALGDRNAGRRVAKHILLVEDDDNVRKALRRLLELDGHRVEVARDGSEGVELALATAPEVAFIDIGLPGIDGYEVARCIRAALGRRIRLVAVTAYGREEDRQRSSKAGFDAHLVKPVSYEDLTRVLDRAAGGDG